MLSDLIAQLPIGIAEALHCHPFLTELAVEVVAPFTKATRPQPFGWPAFSQLDDHPPRIEHVLLRAGANESQCSRSQRELEEPPPERREVVVIALGRGLGDDVDLPVGESELPIQLACLRIASFGVGQIELGRTRLQDDVTVR